MPPQSSAAIDFTTVSREFQSLVQRRRELMTLLGSIFAGLGIFLQNVLQGNLPPSLRTLEDHVVASYALVLMISSVLLSLRMARLHGGMVLNGVLFARLMQDQDFTAKGDPHRSARHNVTGASFLQFVLVDLIAGFSTGLLVLALGLPSWLAAAAGVGVVAAWMVIYLRFHDRAARFAFAKIAAQPCAPFDRQEWEQHTAANLENTNHDLLSCVAFVGLILFSALEALSGLGQIRADADLDVPAELIVRHGPAIYTSLMVVTCVLQLVIYVRLRIALGRFSLDADPTDRPFRPLVLTDSLLGYLLLAFLFAVALHLHLAVLFPALEEEAIGVLLAIDLAAMALAILAEQLALVRAGRRIQIRSAF